MAEYTESICRRCFHSYVCEQFNGHRDDNNKKCHFFNDHFVPAADVAPVRHGRWFDTGVENETGSIYFCSACNKYNNPNKKDVKMRRAKEKPDYCPNCGAKMDLEGGNT